MATVTKKELISRIAERTQAKRVLVKRIVQSFLDEITDELSNDNRLEFRDFGVFETRTRAARSSVMSKGSPVCFMLSTILKNVSIC